jgi:hypothetical protein
MIENYFNITTTIQCVYTLIKRIILIHSFLVSYITLQTLYFYLFIVIMIIKTMNENNYIVVKKKENKQYK